MLRKQARKSSEDTHLTGYTRFENTLSKNTLSENTLLKNTLSENALLRVIMVIRVLMLIRVIRIASVKSLIGILTHQGHISKINANADSHPLNIALQKSLI